MTEEEFKQRFGMKPKRDDLQRVNCKMPGVPGHMFCGICSFHNQPRFLCGCMVGLLTNLVRKGTLQ